MKNLINSPLKNRCIREKLIFITMLTTMFALILSSTVFLIYELVTFRYKIAEDVAELTDFIGDNCKKSLVRNDRKSAEAVLATLFSKENIRLAYLYDANGKIFAQYSHHDAKGLGLLSEGLYHANNRIHSYRLVKQDGKVLGTIYLQSDLRDLRTRLWLYFRILIVVMLCIFLVSLQISSRLQEVISDPILHLVDISTRISENKDYSIRAVKKTNDEVGDLTEAFNQMLKQIEKAEKQLHFEAFHDSLTKLPNRALVLDRLERLIEHSRRNSKYQFAILYIDLDRFKLINDSLGHLQGDLLLKDIGHRLSRYLRKADTIGRIGGDEFVVLLDGIKSVNNTIPVAERIQEELNAPFNLNGQEVYVTASIGITTNKEGYEHPDEYLRDADNAMYKAKALGKARYQLFDSTMHNIAVKTLEMESDLRRAVQNEEFIVYYQPIYSLEDNSIVRLEALLRWQKDEKMISPLEFIDLAEETGLIIPVGHWVFETVCSDLARWNKEGVNLGIAVNFSAKQLEQVDLLEFIQKTLTRNKVHASSLEIEITESVTMQDVESTIKLIKQLRKLGVQISIDDFGMGYSSLNRLRSLPIQKLKIDRSFINLLDKNKSEVAITKAIISMAHNLDFKVVAEGVETEKQLDILKEIKCDEVQGFFLSRPVPKSEVEKLIFPS